MKHGRSHVGKLAQLTVGDRLNRFRIRNDMRIGYKETGHVSPVLIEVCVHGACHDRTCDIRTSS